MQCADIGERGTNVALNLHRCRQLFDCPGELPDGRLVLGPAQLGQPLLLGLERHAPLRGFDRVLIGGIGDLILQDGAEGPSA